MPLFSIGVPGRNEEKTITACISALLADYQDIEIRVVDGCSTDSTVEKVQQLAAKHSNIRLLRNNSKTTPVGMNIGIKAAAGKYIMLFNAHSIAGMNYIRNCLDGIEKHSADNVGGTILSLSGNKTLVSAAIAKLQTCPFAVGNSKFRTGVRKAVEADTVAYGFYRREVFERIGYFNENLRRNQDIEFNIRLRRAGGKIVLLPDVDAIYLGDSDLASYLRKNYLNGLWVIYSLKFAKAAFSLRHVIPLAFVLWLAAGVFLPLTLWSLPLAAYFALSFVYSAKISTNLKEACLIFCLFPLLHITYGLGSVVGFFRLLKGGRH